MSLLYALALGCAIGYASIAGYKIVLTDKLKTDFLNPVECCRRLNSLVVYELCLIFTVACIACLALRDIPAAAAAAPLAVFHLHTFVNHGGTAQYDSTRIFQTLPQAELRQKVLCCAGVAVAAFLLYRTCVELRIWEAFDALHARALKLIMPSLAMGDDFAQQWVHAHA